MPSAISWTLVVIGLSLSWLAAQDLVQEVLVVALTALRDDRTRSPTSSFVLGTCRLSVTNRRRGEQRRTRPRERTVVVLTFYAERDGDAIARELGTSAGTVRVIRHRALARLRECLEIA